MDKEVPLTNRLRRRLHQAAREKRGILFGFLPAGYPSPERFREAARVAFEAGLDALEVSMPGPAPALDGELIQAAARESSRHLPTIGDALRLAASSRHDESDTIVAMAYAHTFEEVTLSAFLDELEAADVDAFLLPQHSVAEQLQLGLQARPRGIEPVVFLHRQEDLALLATTELEWPVIYLQSANLRTGDAFNVAKARERLQEVSEAMGDRPYTVCVGFGVRGYDEVAALMAAGADGAIIGTRLVAVAGEDAAGVAAIVDEVAPALVRREELIQ